MTRELKQHTSELNGQVSLKGFEFFALTLLLNGTERRCKTFIAKLSQCINLSYLKMRVEAEGGGVGMGYSKDKCNNNSKDIKMPLLHIIQRYRQMNM